MFLLRRLGLESVSVVSVALFGVLPFHMGICPAPSCLIERESEMDSCGAESATRRVVWDERGVVWTKRRRRRFPRAGIWALSAGLALLGCARPASGGTPSFLDPTPDIGSVTERVGYVGVPITYSMKATAVGSQNLQIMWNAQDEYRPQVSADPCVGKRENHAGFRADRL